MGGGEKQQIALRVGKAATRDGGNALSSLLAAAIDPAPTRVANVAPAPALPTQLTSAPATGGRASPVGGEGRSAATAAPPAPPDAGPASSSDGSAIWGSIGGAG